jgi:hypothetical protein
VVPFISRNAKKQNKKQTQTNKTKTNKTKQKKTREKKEKEKGKKQKKKKKKKEKKKKKKKKKEEQQKKENEKEKEKESRGSHGSHWVAGPSFHPKLGSGSFVPISRITSPVPSFGARTVILFREGMSSGPAGIWM